MPAAKPSRLKELAGNPSKRAVNKREPKPAAGPSKTPPRDLSNGAKKVWKVLVSAMPAGVFTGCDLELLRAYCEAAAMHRLATEKLKKESLMVEGSQGQPRPNPLIKVQVEQARAIATLGARLGLDPVSRQNIQADVAGGGDDAFGGLLN